MTMGSNTFRAPSSRHRSGSVHRIAKRSTLRRRSRSRPNIANRGMLAIIESMTYLQISGAEKAPVDKEANNSSQAVESPAPSTRQQPTITKLTYQSRVVWTQATIATVSANLERMVLTPGEDALIIGDPITMPPSREPSTPLCSPVGSGTSNPPPNLSASPPTSPRPPLNIPRRRLSINTRYRIPGIQLMVYQRRGRTSIVGSGRTPWRREETMVGN